MSVADIEIKNVDESYKVSITIKTNAVECSVRDVVRVDVSPEHALLLISELANCVDVSIRREIFEESKSFNLNMATKKMP